jgi:hypothetical protein
VDFLDLKLAVEPYLNKLADMKTPEDIRDFLVGEGILAQRGHARACAIAAYVFRETGQMVAVGNIATCPPGKGDTSFAGKMIEGNFLGWHTKAMAQFVVNFDAGDYPELVG